ncbi:MAG: pyridine nucleotide-disulfide oxidoreductase [Chloroflexota bacterium]|nr:MAG: pyridine nucleotide-disulfide oxidoreductase [Chloroflexota bacterium]
MSMAKYPRVVVVGAGFGGLWATKTLARSSVEVTLIDRNNYHTFFPLLYQVAAAELEPADIAYPVWSILRKQSNVRFIMAEVTKVDLIAQVVETDGPIIPYDYLILSMGSSSHFFGIPGAAEVAYPLRTLEQAVALRNHILSCFEQAACTLDTNLRQRLLTFVIVGGGPTGVEFAGALAELVYGSFMADYPTLDTRDVHLVLLEAMGSLLSNLPEPLRRYTLTRLHKKRVEVRLGAQVVQITTQAVQLNDGEIIPTETVIWTAGVRGAPLAQNLGLPIIRTGQVSVLPTLQVEGYPEVYVIGDLASIEEDEHPLPMVAPVAIQQGVVAAQNIIRQIDNRSPGPFDYKDIGTMAVIGRNAAVAHLLGRWGFTGFPAWLLWLGVHLLRLIGFRNRLVVLINWAWDYLFYERVVRLMLPRKMMPVSEDRLMTTSAIPKSS